MRRGFHLLGCAQWEEVLRALDRLLQAAQELLEVVVALDEIDFRGIDDEQVRRGIAEEEMLVGADLSRTRSPSRALKHPRPVSTSGAVLLNNRN